MKFAFINRKTLLVSWFLLSSFLFIFYTKAELNMFGLFKKYDVHLSPEVHGKITLDGLPVENLEIYRGLTYNDKNELIDKTVTDKNGVFSFSEKNIRSRQPGSPFDESSVRQIIDVEYDGERFILWATIARGIKPSAAVSSKLKSLNCDLRNPEEKIKFRNAEDPRWGYLVKTICRW